MGRGESGEDRQVDVQPHAVDPAVDDDFAEGRRWPRAQFARSVLIAVLGSALQIAAYAAGDRSAVRGHHEKCGRPSISTSGPLLVVFVNDHVSM